MDEIHELIAQQNIRDVMHRYARGVDRRDWPSVRTCFHDDAVDRHGEFTGNADAFIEWVSKRHADLPFSMHFLGNCLIEFINAEQAIVETYFIAIQRREKPEKAMDHEVFGRYCDRFERRDGVWRIAARFVAYDSTRNQPSTNHLRELVGVLGQRDQNDPIYRLCRGEN